MRGCSHFAASLMKTLLVKSDYVVHLVQPAMCKWQSLPVHVHHMMEDQSGGLLARGDGAVMVVG